MNKKLLEPFYDKVVHPAAAAVVSDHFVRTWPPTYEDEEARARKDTGRPQFSGKSILGTDLKALVPKMREIVTSSPDLVVYRNWFWMVEMKGVKASTTHPPPTETGLDEGMLLHISCTALR